MLEKSLIYKQKALNFVGYETPNIVSNKGCRDVNPNGGYINAISNIWLSFYYFLLIFKFEKSF